MPRYPETLALLEQALRHVLSEQEKLLKRKDAGELTPVISELCALALRTSTTIAEGFNHTTGTAFLTKDARRTESIADALSESLWTPIMVSVSAIYERAERALKPEAGKYGFASEIRTHYHNLRLRLLEQMIGARMLASSSDLGDEVERIWQQFLERQLGPMFRVLRGGFICDQQGNKSCQMDLIVVPADSHVFVPGDSEGGKAHVLADQVLSAILVTANLTTEKLESDWGKLQSLPLFAERAKDYPQLEGHPWPLCYILGVQSDSAEELKQAWVAICTKGVPVNVPQLVIALDAGVLYCGLRKWPSPRYPGNYVEATHVRAVTELFAGLGLAWLIAQHQGRLAAMRKQATGPISRFAHLLDTAMMPKEGVPPTYSQRFDCMFQMRQIAGVMEWGSVACWAHNGLQLRCLARKRGDADVRMEVELLLPGTDTATLDWRSYTEFLRWFRYDSEVTAGRLLAVEEWLNHKSKAEHKSRIAVFDTISGEEIMGASIDGLKSANEIERVQAELEAGLPQRPADQGPTASPSA